MTDQSGDLPLYEPDTNATYSLDWVAQRVGVSSSTIVHYQEQGLVPAPPGETHFTDEDLHTLRRIEHLKSAFETNLEGLRLILDLMREVEQLRAALRLRR